MAEIIGAFLGLGSQYANLAIGLTFMIYITIFGLEVRILFTLIKAYLSIIILTVFGPLVICLSAAPTSKGSPFTGWFKLFLANALIFPAVGLVLGLGNWLVAATQTGSQYWSAPLIGNSTGLVKEAVALGILLTIPQVEGLINKLVGAGVGLPLQGLALPDLGVLGGSIGGALAKGLSAVPQAGLTMATNLKALRKAKKTATGVPPPPTAPPAV